ncbi:MAG: ferredoxin [Candidatus Magasanikbacteria bacterium]|jgi:ferredoxin
MNPKVDKELCIGCGTCEALASNTFHMNDDGKAIVVNPNGDPDDMIQMSCDSCPTKAIIIE